MLYRPTLAILFVLSSLGCESTPSSGDAATPTDAPVVDTPPVDTPPVDVPPADVPTPAGDYYELNATRQNDPFTKDCTMGGGRYVIVGRVGGATGGTAFTFTFQSPPTPGSYTIEPRIAGPTSVPSSATSVWVDYGAQVRGGSDEMHVGQSGTVTVSMAGGRLRATTSGIASVERSSMAAGTVGAQITCP